MQCGTLGLLYKSSLPLSLYVTQPKRAKAHSLRLFFVEFVEFVGVHCVLRELAYQEGNCKSYKGATVHMCSLPCTAT